MMVTVFLSFLGSVLVEVIYTIDSIVIAIYHRDLFLKSKKFSKGHSLLRVSPMAGRAAGAKSAGELDSILK